MSFLNASLLIGLSAVAIPIVIHLLNRRRFRKVRWAAMRFLQVSVEQNQRRMKLEDLILLALRVLLFALLALALARPVVKGLEGVLPSSGVAAVVLVDTSASMGSATRAGTRLEEAREVARTVVERLPAGSAVAVATPFQPDEPTTDRALALRRIEELSQTDRHADLRRALEQAAEVLDGQRSAEKELYLITDGHAEEWGAFGSMEETLRDLSARLSVQLVLVGEERRENLAISRTEPSGVVPAIGRPFRIDVDVTNHGEAPVVDIPVRLFLDGQPVEGSWSIGELPPGRSETVSLYVTLPAPGLHRVTVGLDGDAVPFDNRRSLIVRAVEEVRVLLVDGDPGGEAREAETFFLRHALVPVAEEELDEHPVRPVVVSSSELNGIDWSSYAVVVLANVSDLAPETSRQLAGHVRDGGGLIIFPGEHLRAESYNGLLGAKHGLLPAALAPGDSPGGSSLRTLVPTETNPLGLDADLLATASFREAIALDVTAGGGRVLLRYDDGAPALVEGSHGLGKVFLFSSTVDTAWNDLAVTPAFVPLVNRLVAQLVQHRDAGLNVDAGQVVHTRLPAELTGREATVYEVADPESLGTLAVVGEEDDGAVLTFEGTHRGGVYEASIDGRDDPLLFAVRPSARESSLDLLTDAQVGQLGGLVRVTGWQTDGGMGEVLEARSGSELWLLLVLLVIVIAVVELGLAQWFSRAK